MSTDSISAAAGKIDPIIPNIVANGGVSEQSSAQRPVDATTSNVAQEAMKKTASDSDVKLTGKPEQSNVEGEGYLSAAYASVTGAVSSAYESVTGAVSSAYESVAGTVSSTCESVQTFFVTTIPTAATDVAGQVASVAQSATNFVAEYLPDVVNNTIPPALAAGAGVALTKKAIEVVQDSRNSLTSKIVKASALISAQAAIVASTAGLSAWSFKDLSLINLGASLVTAAWKAVQNKEKVQLYVVTNETYQKLFEPTTNDQKLAKAV